MTYKRVLICGGRDYDDFGKMTSTIVQCAAYFDQEVVFIEGDAPGADRLAGTIALGMGYPVIKMPASWNALGKRAGSVRNQWMLDFAMPDFVIAFPGGSGTADMVKRAKAKGLQVYEI